MRAHSPRCEERGKAMSAVGVSLERIDGAEKIAGRAVYAGDLRLPGMAYAKVLRSTVPHARIRRIDCAKARAMPGVLGVLTRDNLHVASNSFGAYVRDQQILAGEKVRYIGDMVAAVAAADRGSAAAAVELIDVDYEELPAVYTVEDALGAEALREVAGSEHVLSRARVTGALTKRPTRTLPGTS